MSDFLEVLGRSGAEFCPHRVHSGYKCTVCSVILYDNDDYIKEATFSDLLIASPRKKAPLTTETLQNQFERMERISLALKGDQRAPILYQKEYIAANIAKSEAVRSKIVTFKNNASRSREALFPKLIPARVEYTATSTQQVDSSAGIISLARSDSSSRLRIRIVLPPYGADASVLVIDVDDSVSGRELIDAIINDHESGLDASKAYVLRWVEDEEELVPDLDLPPVDPDQPLTSINTNVLCLCDIEYDSDANESGSSF